MITWVRGDILIGEPVDAMVNPVNVVGVSGSGLALSFKTAFPENYAAYVDCCEDDLLRPGEIFTYRLRDREEAHRPWFIFNAATKAHWLAPSQLAWVEGCLRRVVEESHRLGLKTVSVPAIGCGRGNLLWRDVRPIFEKVLAPDADVTYLVYEPLP